MSYPNLTISRCSNNPLIGKPHKITTVDKYQGQQNDYILLSLVKTNNVGHLRDVRRLIVAMSRARLGKMNHSLFCYGTQIVTLTSHKLLYTMLQVLLDIVCYQRLVTSATFGV